MDGAEMDVFCLPHLNTTSRIDYVGYYWDFGIKQMDKQEEERTRADANIKNVRIPIIERTISGLVEAGLDTTATSAILFVYLMRNTEVVNN